MKKLLSIVLTLSLIFSLVPTALAEEILIEDFAEEVQEEAISEDVIIDEGECGDNVKWKLSSEGVLAISGEGDMYDYVPSDVPWYDYRDNVKEVVISDGVTSIGDSAF
ncbi:MAG: hypothetical protein ACI3XA_01990, partial [Clostridia bacterium]